VRGSVSSASTVRLSDVGKSVRGAAETAVEGRDDNGGSAGIGRGRSDPSSGGDVGRRVFRRVVDIWRGRARDERAASRRLGSGCFRSCGRCSRSATPLHYHSEVRVADAGLSLARLARTSSSRLPLGHIRIGGREVANSRSARGHVPSSDSSARSGVSQNQGCRRSASSPEDCRGVPVVGYRR